ncbi:Serine/threonine-protein phosphatase 6 regulatory subunit 3 [Fasciolopsis buskii]|uniref:Serine/threonine-protein phosphatase 6 regulatory subunit 3 n=1 Tax=Fasciolopsis buskii TaxID=27845 RepID=A0A8E0RSC3_9TREM|nr:Serine/threonine-protein phosphatase 6 regulatory subunit 3 [Fasciolopsis buski]
MFWSSLAAQSRINDLLDQPDLTIEELLDDDEVLQKCCERDQRVIDFLCRAENMDFMINVISNPPNSDDFDKSLYRYSSLVCEILTCIIPRVLDLIVGSAEGLSSSEKTEDGSQMEDTWNSSSMEVDDSVNKSTTKHPSAQNALSCSDVSIEAPGAAAGSTVTGNESRKPEGTNSVLPNESKNADSRPHLDRLLRAVQPDVALNPLTASFLSRVLVHLAVNRSQIVIPYMRKFPNLLDNIVARLELTAMADLLIQLAQQEQCARTLFEWFVEGNLVPRLIDCFVPSNSWEVHESAAHCLIQLIVILRSYLVNSAHSGPNADPTSTDFGSGLPANNPYAILMSEDEASLAAATRLLDILESETGFALSAGGLVSGMELEMWLGDNLCNPSNLFRPTPFSGSAAPLGPSASATVPAAGGNASAVNSTSSGGDSRSAPNGTDRPESIDKLRIARASINLARACRSRLSQLHALLRHPHEQHYNRMNTTAGLLDPPLGRCRLSVAQFLALLAALPLHTGIQEAMVADGVIKTLMNLFEMYPLNTLLHQAVRDFIMALFTHARVIEKSAVSNQAGDKGKVGVGNDSIGPLQNFTSTSSSAMTVSTKPPTTNSDPSTAPMEIDTSELKTTGQANSEPISTVLDEAFRTILRDHLITEWCLRLSPIPRDRSSSDPDVDTAVVRESKRHPKPGYSGHLWQLANLIQDARTGPRGEWVNGLMQGLDSASLKSWDEFVQGDLATINREQTIDQLEQRESNQIRTYRIFGIVRSERLTLRSANQLVGIINPLLILLLSGLRFHTVV